MGEVNLKVSEIMKDEKNLCNCYVKMCMCINTGLKINGKNLKISIAASEITRVNTINTRE